MEDRWEAVIAGDGPGLTAAFTDPAADPRMAEVARELIAINARKLARYLAAPEGRALLRWGINTPEGRTWLGQDAGRGDHQPTRAVREEGILKWAFAAELRQLNISPEQAVSLVNQGITLRDIKSKSAEELAERRLDLVKAMSRKEVTPETVASTLQDSTLEGYLLEQWSKYRLEEEFRKRRHELKAVDRSSDGDADKGGVQLLGQEVAQRDLELKSPRKLAESWIAQVAGDYAYITKALEDREKRLLEVSPSPDWIESEAEGWLTREFQRLKGELERNELIWSGIAPETAVAFLEQGITLSEMKSRSAQELTEAFVARATVEGTTLTQAVERVLGADYLWDELERIGREDGSEEAIGQWRADRIWQWHDTQVRRLLFEEFASSRGRIEEAEKAGRDLFAVRFYDLLVVSDFHLAAGNHPSAEGIARLSPTEDFYFDDAFFRFLHYCDAERREREGFPYELVFNGDMIDFAQVVVPDERGDGSLEPWALPPLWLQEAASQSETDRRVGERGEGQRLPERLRAILKEVYDLREVIPTLGEEPQYPEHGDWSEEDRQDWYSDWLDAPVEQSADWTEQQWEAWAYETPTWRRWDELALEEWSDKVEEERAGRRIDRRKIHVMHRKAALSQLADVYFGHRRFFQGLAWFLAQGNRLVVIRGNHDPPLYWPEVQLALIGWLKTAYDDLQRECRSPAGHELPVDPQKLEGHFPEMDVDDFEKRVDFCHSWYYYRERLAYLEHGGQYDAMNSHRYFLRPVWSPWQEVYETEIAGEPPDSQPQGFLPRVTDWLPDLEVGVKESEIDSAWGNVGLHLVNILENEFPNFERPGYQKVYFKWLLYHRPSLLFRKLIPALLRTLWAWVVWAFGTVGWGRDFVAGVRRRERDEEEPMGQVQSFVARGLRGDYDATSLEAYAQLTGLSLAQARALDRTPWVNRWRWPGSGLVYAVLNVLVITLLVVVIILGLAELFGLISVYDDVIRGLVSRLASALNLPGSSGDGRRIFGDLLLDLGKMFIVGLATYWLITAVRRFINLREDYLFRPAQRVAGILKSGWDVPYILFGHDHAHNAQPLSVGAWCTGDNCVTELRKRDVRLAAGYHLEIEGIDCAKCGACVDLQAVQREVDSVLTQPREPRRYAVRCRNCHQETFVVADTDLDGRPVRCENCRIELVSESLERLPWTRLSDFGIDSLHCQCGEPLPQPIVEKARLLPPHVTTTCPRCARTEQQWLGTWNLNCPDCGQRPRKPDIHLLENRAFVHCRCGRRYPELQPLSRWYLNTGTWMHMFATERKRLVREALEYPFVRMIDTHRVLASGPDDYMRPNSEVRPKVQLLRWNDAAGRVESCETFRGTDEERWQNTAERWPRWPIGRKRKR